MENDDFSKIVRAFDDKTEPSSRFFMPDNFYDEKANIINDFETVKKEHFVGDPALRPKDSNPSFNATNIKDSSINIADVDNRVNIDTGNSFVNSSNNVFDGGDSVFNRLVNGSGGIQESVNSFDVHAINVDNTKVSSDVLNDKSNGIDTSELFNPKFFDTASTDNSTFVSNDISSLPSDLDVSLNNISTSYDDNSSLSSSNTETTTGSETKVISSSVNDNNGIDVKTVFTSKNSTNSNDNDINKILSNALGVNFSTDDNTNSTTNHVLYDDLQPVSLDTSNKINVPSLDSNFTVSDNNNFVDKTLSSHREFSSLDLGRDISYVNNQDEAVDEVSGFSYNNQWQNIPKSTYKAGAVNVPVIIDDSSSLSVNNTGPKVFSKVVEDNNYNDVSVNEQDNIIDSKNDVQSWINRILKVDNSPVKINSDGSVINNVSNDVINHNVSDTKVNSEQSNLELDIDKFTKKEVDYDFSVKDLPVHKSDLLVTLEEKQEKENKISILVRYGEDFCSKDYITNPAIGRSNEIKQLILILLTPEKSGILVGKPGIGKTSIVEGLAYQLQRDNVPEALKGYTIVNVKTASLLGTLPSGETRLQTLIDELKDLEKVILFIDEIHMLIGATNESALDFANMFKEGLGRGKIKVIGATTTEEYERYILRDKAFVRRFQKVEVLEPNREHTIRILMGTLPKIEKTTNAKLKYDSIIQGRIMGFIVDITSEYKRIYGIGSRYPDICLTLLSQAFSQAVFDDRKEVNIFDIRNAIENSKNIYPDVIRKELQKFDKMFENVIREEQGLPPLEEVPSRF